MAAKKKSGTRHRAKEQASRLRRIPTQALLDELRKLALLGDTPTLRRAITVVLQLAEHRRPARPCCPMYQGEQGEIFRPEWPCSAEPLSEERVLREAREEDARQMLFLDPSAALRKSFGDMWRGRLRVIEIRGGGTEQQIESLASRAIDESAKQVPAVQVNLVPHISHEEIASTLRVLADRIAALAKTPSLLDKLKHETLFAEFRSCAYKGTDHLGSRWSGNGKRLEYQYADKYFCSTNDGCCGNQSYYEYRNYRWELVWVDSGNPTQQPPQLPPLFENEPWANRLPVFQNQHTGNLTSDYGWRNDEGVARFHSGLDVGASAGSIVVSNVNGRIVHINRSSGEQIGVIVLDGSNVTHTYWHIMTNTSLDLGDRVTPGDQLGRVYNWGDRSHLHYAEHSPPNGNWVDRRPENSRDPLP